MSLLSPPERDLLPAEPGPELDELEAIIEEARCRARRRRRRYGAWALVVAVAGLVGYFGVSNGGSALPQVGRDRPAVALHPAGPADLTPVAGIEGGSISALAVDPQSPETVFAGTDRGLFKSTDGGGSWRPLTNGLGAKSLVSLAIAPADPQTVYAGTGLGVFKTTNGGASWRAVNEGLFDKESAYERERRLDEGYVQTLVVDARDAETVYADTARRGLFKSTNGGESWQHVGGEGVVAVDPNDRGTIYAAGDVAAGSSTRIYKSTDAGSTWRTVGPQRKEGAHIYHLAIDPQRSQTLYASTDYEVLKSVDGGQTWRAVSPPGRWVNAFAIDPQHTNTLYLGSTDAGIFKSIDGGRTWKVLHAGREARPSINALEVDPSNPGTLYAGTSGAGVLKSNDSGRSWQVSAAGITAARVDALAAPSRGSAYALVSSQGLFKRAHHGWRPVFTYPRAMLLTVLAVDPQRPETVYVVTDDGRIFKTRDGGDTWRSLPTPPIPDTTEITALVIDPQNPRNLYAGTFAYDNLGRDGVFKSSDGGATWRAPQRNGPILGPTEVSELAIDPRNPNNLHATGTSDEATGTAYFNSDDAGATWNAPHDFGRSFGDVRALALDPSEPATLYAGTAGAGVPTIMDGGELFYAGTAGAGVLKSTDGGANWSDLKVSFKDQPVNGLAVNPHARQTVYAGTDHGLFVSTDGGEHWHRYQGGDLLARGINDLAIDPSGSTLYIGGNAGVFELSLASQ
jgi:photosystem II stability/assembly factor-like uncharacterized protein